MTDLDAFAADLQALRQDAMRPAAFCERARSRTALLQQLPPRYGEVLANVLDRLEAGALFTEESCSFSQRDLLDALQSWLDKARAQLAKQGPQPVK